MPCTLQVGLSRKIGLPEFSSIGANCSLTIEIDGALLADLDALKSRIEQLQSIVARAVDDEIGEQSRALPAKPAKPAGREPGEDRVDPRHQANGRDHANGRPAERRFEHAGASRAGNDRGRDRDGGPGRRDDRAPLTGNALIAKIRTFDDELAATGHAKWLEQAMTRWAKTNHLPPLFNKWTTDEVAEAWKEVQYLKSAAESQDNGRSDY